MLASNVKLKTLITHEDHINAIDNIERDYRNVLGGIIAWNSGRQTYLTRSAEKKIAAINVRLNKIKLNYKDC